VSTAVTVADVNNEGASEIIVGASSAGVQCFDQDGELMWTAPVYGQGDGFKTIAAADVHPNAGLELLLGYNDGWLHCIGAEGLVLWRFFGDRFRVGPPAVGDATGDGIANVVYGTDNGHVYCLDGWGRVLWRNFLDLPFGRSAPVIADLDNDGAPEVLITISNVNDAPGLLCLDGKSGELRWRSQDEMQGYASIVPVDLDGDGTLEIIHADKGNNIYCENADGSRRWQARLNGRGIYFAPAVADLDGDGRPGNH
jgi:outer membrane protein assembly factor BamB